MSDTNEDREAIARLLGKPFVFGALIDMGGKSLTNLASIDGLVSLWPEPWIWTKDENWRAYPSAVSSNRIEVVDTGDFLADFTRLLRLVLEAKG